MLINEYTITVLTVLKAYGRSRAVICASYVREKCSTK